MTPITRCVALLLFLATFGCAAHAVTFTATCEPSGPLFVAGPQGRPIPNATVAVTDPVTGTPVSMFQDPACTVAFPSTLNATQIVQFYGAAGIYQVTISGAGISKTYFVGVGAAFAERFKEIWIDRTADVLRDIAGVTAPLSCPAFVCNRVFDCTDPTEDLVFFDFAMPPFAVSSDYVKLEWASDTASKTVTWRMGWCTYTAGDNFAGCSPGNFTNVTTASSTTPNAITHTTFPGPFAWTTTQHVVVSLERVYPTTPDTCHTNPGNVAIPQIAHLVNIGLHFTRQ